MLNLRSSKHIRLSTILAFILVGTAVLLFSQTGTDDYVKSFTWREIGPANPGGRIIDVEGVNSNPKIVYVGAATGRTLENHQCRHNLGTDFR